MPDPIKILDELRCRKREQPFRPFEIEMVSGDRFKVADRWAYAGNSKIVAVYDEAERSSRLKISEVRSITDITINAA